QGSPGRFRLPDPRDRTGSLTDLAPPARSLVQLRPDTEVELEPVVAEALTNQKEDGRDRETHALEQGEVERHLNDRTGALPRVARGRHLVARIDADAVGGGELVATAHAESRLPQAPRQR